MTRRHTFQVAAIAIVVLVFILILRGVNYGKLADALVGVSWLWLVAIVLLNLLNTWIEAVRWKMIVSSIKPEARTWNTFVAILAGVAGNAVLAFRLGDGLRALVLARREKLTVATSLGTEMLDRIADVTIFLAIVVVTGLVLDLPARVRKAAIAGGVALVVAVVAMVLLIRFRRHLEATGGRGFGAKVAAQIHRFTIGLSALRNAGILLPVSLLSVVSWGIRLTMVLAVYRAFHLGLSAIAAAVFLIFSNLGIAALSTPANLGGFEIGGLGALRLFGVETEHALGCTLVFHLVEVVPMALLGLAVLWHMGIKSRDFLAQPASR